MIKLLIALTLIPLSGGNRCCRLGQAENRLHSRGPGRATDRHDLCRGAPAACGYAHASGH